MLLNRVTFQLTGSKKLLVTFTTRVQLLTSVSAQVHTQVLLRGKRSIAVVT